jgi:hypothetical protein
MPARALAAPNTVMSGLVMLDTSGEHRSPGVGGGWFSL